MDFKIVSELELSVVVVALHGFIFSHPFCRCIYRLHFIHRHSRHRRSLLYILLLYKIFPIKSSSSLLRCFTACFHIFIIFNIFYTTVKFQRFNKWRIDEAFKNIIVIKCEFVAMEIE